MVSSVPGSCGAVTQGRGVFQGNHSHCTGEAGLPHPKAHSIPELRGFLIRGPTVPHLSRGWRPLYLLFLEEEQVPGTSHSPKGTLTPLLTLKPAHVPTVPAESTVLFPEETNSPNTFSGYADGHTHTQTYTHRHTLMYRRQKVSIPNALKCPHCIEEKFKRWSRPYIPTSFAHVDSVLVMLENKK